MSALCDDTDTWGFHPLSCGLALATPPRVVQQHADTLARHRRRIGSRWRAHGPYRVLPTPKEASRPPHNCRPCVTWATRGDTRPAGPHLAGGLGTGAAAGGLLSSHLRSVLAVRASADRRSSPRRHSLDRTPPSGRAKLTGTGHAKDIRRPSRAPHGPLLPELDGSEPAPRIPEGVAGRTEGRTPNGDPSAGREGRPERRLRPEEERIHPAHGGA